MRRPLRWFAADARVKVRACFLESWATRDLDMVCCAALYHVYAEVETLLRKT